MFIIFLVATTKHILKNYRANAQQVQTYVSNFLKHAKNRLGVYGNFKSNLHI